MIKASVLFLSMFLFNACVSIVMPDPSLWKKIDPPQLTSGFDVYFLRVDIQRSYYQVKNQFPIADASGNIISYYDEWDPVPYDYNNTIIDFGNGIILDYNTNLCLDLARFYGFVSNKNFNIEGRDTALFSVSTTYNKIDNKFIKTVHNLFGTKTTIDIPGSDYKVTNHMIDDYRIIGNLISTVYGNIPHFLYSENNIKFNFNHDSEFFENSTAPHDCIFIRTETGCCIYKYSEIGTSVIEVKRDSNLISVFNNGRMIRSYIINMISDQY
jgi:hypothetical protein